MAQPGCTSALITSPAGQLPDDDAATRAQRHRFRARPLAQHRLLDRRGVLGQQVLSIRAVVAGRCAGCRRGGRWRRRPGARAHRPAGAASVRPAAHRCAACARWRRISSSFFCLSRFFLLLGQALLLLRLFHALLLGQVDLLLAALGFLLAQRLFLRKRQAAGFVLVLGIRNRNAFLRRPAAAAWANPADAARGSAAAAARFLPRPLLRRAAAAVRARAAGRARRRGSRRRSVKRGIHHRQAGREDSVHAPRRTRTTPAAAAPTARAGRWHRRRPCRSPRRAGPLPRGATSACIAT